MGVAAGVVSPSMNARKHPHVSMELCVKTYWKDTGVVIALKDFWGKD